MTYSFSRLIFVLTMLLSPLWAPSMASDNPKIQNNLINNAANNAANQGKSQDAALLDSLLEEKSIQPLLQHHRIALREINLHTIARELLTLTRGDAWQLDPVAYLSTNEVQPDGNKDFEHARSLGHWLGSVQTIITEQGFKSSESADWFTSLLGTLEPLSNSTNTSNFQGLAHDIANNRISLNEAMELLSYGNVTSSTVTTVIGQGIRASQRRAAQ